MEAGRQAECPNCGAPIAWRLASSHAAVCGFCRFSVVRSDRALSALGRVADLVPTAAPIAVGDEGTVGGKAFRVLGRLQLDHGRGPWDEWYLAFADDSWGWLARAQGRWYLTFARDGSDAPAWEALTPGSSLSLASTGSLHWIVSERGGSALLSAEGELPFPVDPQASGRYADLEGGGGAFATLDYGDGSAPAQLYAGRELTAAELTVKQTAVGPRPIEKVAVERLVCPSCGAPVPIFVPNEAERCGCAACGALLDHAQGTLQLLQQLAPPPMLPTFALGSEAELFGARRTLIGFMQRSVTVEGDHYTFREYLLHADSGYAWLVEENRHFLYVAPVAASAVAVHGGSARYRDRSYRLFARNTPRVDFVVGEFYWKVAQGDVSQTEDYVAPPYCLSVERSDDEINWSAGEYVASELVYRAFGSKDRPLEPIGVAPAQPNPFKTRGGGLVLALLALLWFLLAYAYELGTHKDVVFDGNLALPMHANPYALQPDGARESDGTVLVPSFDVRRGPTTIAVEVESPISNGWVQVNAALVAEGSATPRELPLLVEHYQGVSSDGSWSEGSTDSEGYFGRVAAGRYSMRLVGSWEPYQPTMPADSIPPNVRVRVVRGQRSAACCVGTLLLLLLPWLLTRVRAQIFEAKRRENENL